MAAKRGDRVDANGDDLVKPRQPGRILLWTIVLMVAVDLLLSAALPPLYLSPPTRFERASDVRAYLSHVTNEPGEPWLLLGDSVLAGSVVAPQVSDWPRHRVVEYMRDLKRYTFPQSFHQIALDGLLPVDVNHIAEELDRLDPTARVSLLIELNPRFFSSAYASNTFGSRPWLAPSTGARRVRDWISEHLPVLRHRRHFSSWLPEASIDTLLTVDSETAPPQSELSKNARIMAHYRDLSLNDESAQIRALQSSLERFRASGRRSVFFTTPLNGRFMREVSPTEAQSAYIARMSELIDGTKAPSPPGDDAPKLVNLDAPIFRPEHFIDHCHLLPAGSRLLAANLLQELNVGVAEPPVATRMVYPEGADYTLVSRVSQGYSDGAAWQALFDTPRGLTIDSEARIFIADTRNHCIRELVGNYQTVRTVAGRPGQPGRRDGPRHEARLSFPTYLSSLSDGIYFVDGRERNLLRVLRADEITTVHSEQWRRIDGLRARNGKLYVLDEGRQIVEHDPVAESSRVVFPRPARATGRLAEEPIMSFDIATDGHLYLADRRGRIWKSTLDSPEQDELLFANSGTHYLPTGDAQFPLRFDDLLLADVQDLRYVERYRGILVQDRDPPKPSQYEPTESIHLRFLDLDDRLVYPWIKPLTAGNIYMTPNHQSESVVSPFHQGVMAIHQASASLFYLETRRSRLFVVGDGLWGSARVSHSPLVDFERGTPHTDPFGERLGELVLAAMRPDRFLGKRLERHDRTGPYVGAFIGSSFTVTSDVSSQYSLARSVEARLEAMLGYQDRIRYEQMSRMRAGLRFSEAVELFEEHVAQGVKLDAAIFALNRRPLIDPNQYPIYLERLRRASESYDTRILLLDNGGLGAVYREGLRETDLETRRLLALAATMGFDVIELSDSLLADHLRVVPWGSPPYDGNHASPWAIEATAALIAERVYPVLEQHFQGRLPGYQRPDAPPVEAIDPSRFLTGAFGKDTIDWSEQGLDDVEPAAIQRRFDGRRMQIYVDLTRAGWNDLSTDEHATQRTVLSVLHDLLVVDRAGHTATEARVTLATFSNYDEYGQGILASAVIQHDVALDRDALEAEIDSYLATRPQGRPPLHR